MPPACPFLLGRRRGWPPRWFRSLAPLPPLAPIRLLRRLTLLLLAAALALGLGSRGPWSQPAAAAAPDGLVVLAFHEIAAADEAVLPDYAVTPEQFAADLDWLERQGHHFVGLDQVLRARAGGPALPPKPLLLSFDDGYRSVYTAAWPVLQRHRAPAVLALVGRWLEPADGLVPFGDGTLPRQKLLSWEQLHEMTASGLVEVASHTHDLHRGINANPQGNSEPAVTSRRYSSTDGYESESQYRRRLRQDLARNNRLLQQKLGQRPRAVAWPYGRYNATAIAVAGELGLPVGLTLDDGAITRTTSLAALPRVLMTREMNGIDGLAQELALRRRNADDTLRAAKVMHVDLDNIYDPDPQQTERNLQLLLRRIRAMGVNTVYLQAYADPDGNGAADAVYFPNRHLPVRADLFNHVAWEIRTRTPVKRLYAWMPVLAFELPRQHPAADQRVQTQPSRGGHLTMGYPRLSPYAPQAMAAVREIYTDLSRRATFDGLLFHDDATLSDYEDASPWGLAQYRRWGLPADLARIRASDPLQGRWVHDKTRHLNRLTADLAAIVRENQPQLRTARNLYAQVVLNPKAEVWYSQSLDDALRQYDFTAVMAMPYMERQDDGERFLRRLVERVADQPRGLERTLFELQSTDWHQRRDLPSTELAQQIRTLYALGVQHVGYYPDNLHRGTPDPAVIAPVLAAHSSAPAG